jgi:diguanylate cyclase (GGDEF)-like protein
MAYVAVLTALAGAYLSSPDGLGGIALFATAAVGLLAFAVGPLVHRPVNRRPWLWLTAAGALFLVGLLVRLGLVALPGALGNADLWAFGGYACTAPFLMGLLRRTHTGPDPTLWLDTGAITIGSALIGWVMNIAPQLRVPHVHLGPAVVNTLYPVMDAMLLALTVQLGFRRGSRAPALQSALTGLSALLIGDLSYTFIWAEQPGAVNPYVNVLYLISYACMGTMAAHPSMRELSDVDVRYTPQMSRPRLVVIFLAMITPASIPIMLPTYGPLDGAVRAVIMGVFGTLVFLRLLGTINALRRAEAEAQHRATHDGLTGLPNRLALTETLDAHLARVKFTAPARWVNVLFLDVDHFKQINDSLGHAAGDEVLVQFARRLRALTRSVDHLSRVGGDEFVLRADTDVAEQVTVLAGRILDMFDEPLEISDGRRALLTPSIGISQVRSSAEASAEDLIRDADLALYEAKAAGRATYSVYDTSMRERVARRHCLAEALRGALGRGEITVVFQPIRGGAHFEDLTGWEALARWDHHELGPVSPFEFIPIAEDTGLIVDIGAFVLHAAAIQLAEWQRRFARRDVHVSVNVSSVQLLRGDVLGLVSQVLAETGLDPASLWLEITESVVLERTEEAIGVLNELADLGVKLCMDDFGTGYSSLSYLKDFTIHILKVDKAFVRNLVDDPRDRELTKAMIDVATALRLEGVVAEGVETAEQAALLADLGCSLAQGYLFGRPVLAAQATEEAEPLLVRPAGGLPVMGDRPESATGSVPRPREPGSTTPSSVPDRARHDS